jgi:hypothetical protein
MRGSILPRFDHYLVIWKFSTRGMDLYTSLAVTFRKSSCNTSGMPRENGSCRESTLNELNEEDYWAEYLHYNT